MLFYTLMSIALTWLAVQLYLFYTDQHIHFHWQNTSEKRRPEPTWRNGRAWFSLSYNSEKRHHEWYPPPTIHPWWHLFHKSDIQLEISLASDEHDIALYLGFLFGSFGIMLEGTRFFRWLFKNVTRMGFGYDTGFRFNPWVAHLTFYLAYNDMASGPGLAVQHPRWYRRLLLRLGKSRKKVRRLIRPTDPLPSGINFWRAANWSKNYPTGGGIYLSFDFDRMIRGSYERDVEIIGPAQTVEIPIEPDNGLGFRYFAQFQPQKETRYRGNWPWRNWKQITTQIDIRADKPPMHAGKGENSWDLDDDGIFGVTTNASTIDEAVAYYQKCVYRDRRKYGMPGNIPSEMHEVGR